jgi:hypothetical protein
VRHSSFSAIQNLYHNFAKRPRMNRPIVSAGKDDHPTVLVIINAPCRRPIGKRNCILQQFDCLPETSFFGHQLSSFGGAVSLSLGFRLSQLFHRQVGLQNLCQSLVGVNFLPQLMQILFFVVGVSMYYAL